jgi:hypothetical protein
MHQISKASLEYQQRRWLRPEDAERWLRYDAHRRLDAATNEREVEVGAEPAADREVAAQLQTALLRLRSQLAAEAVLIKARRFLELYKAYNPDQPRWPAGSGEDSGRWRPADGAARAQLASVERPATREVALRAALQLMLGAIRRYRRENTLNDLLDDERGTVAVTKIKDKLIFGVNSGISKHSTAYTDTDYASATSLRDTMLEKYPDVMNHQDVGQFPNDAIFHAETTVLMRAARENGGTLEGESLIVFVDKAMCNSCKKLLPKIGLELGNPTVTFIDRRGMIRTMRDGRWD